MIFSFFFKDCSILFCWISNRKRLIRDDNTVTIEFIDRGMHVGRPIWGVIVSGYKPPATNPQIYRRTSRAPVHFRYSLVFHLMIFITEAILLLKLVAFYFHACIDRFRDNK